MILLDTNVVSELRRTASGKVDAAVVGWTKTVGGLRVFLSTITILELRIGVLLKARRDPAQAEVLDRWLERQIIPLFRDCILPVDIEVALACAPLHVPVTRSRHDALIAATALVHDLTIATRNVRDFAGTGVRLVNPWDYRVGTGSGPA